MSIKESDVSLSQISKASTVSEPVRAPTGPYWQMVHYAVAGFLFWAILMIQMPFIDIYFGGPSVIFYLTFSYGLASNLARIVLIYNANRSKASQAIQMRNLVNYGSIFTAISMAAYPVSMAILGKSNGDIGFWVCIVLAAMVGIWNSLLMNAGFGLMSMAPEKSATFFLIGQTTTSIFTWPFIIVLRLLVRALGGDDQTDYIVGIISLTFAAAVTLCTIPLYRYKTRCHPVFAHILLNDSPVDDGRIRLQSRPIIAVFKTIYQPALAGWLCMLITFCVFPTQIALWNSQPDAPYSVSEYRSFIIYSFAIADTIGRALPRIFARMQKVSDRTLLLCTFARGLVFVPLMLMSSHRTAEFFMQDWFRLVMVFMFGMTNGANYALANMLGPRRVEACDKMHVGTILSFTAINGLLVGSSIGVGFKYV